MMTDTKPRYDIYSGINSEEHTFSVFNTFGTSNSEVSPGFYMSADTIELATNYFLSGLFECGFAFAFIVDTTTNTIIKTSIGSKDELENEYKKMKGIDILPRLELDKSKNWIAESKNKFGKNIDNKYYGISCESNQLILNNILIVGAYPELNEILILRRLGINVICCLNDEYGKYVKGRIYNPYKGHLLDREQFIHEPIPDMKTIADNKIDELSDKLVALILDGKKVYLHCGGGHGRAGMVACVTLHKLYPELSDTEIMDYVQFTHDQRTGTFDRIKFNRDIKDTALAECFIEGQVPSPQTSAQRDLVSRVIQNNKKRIDAKKNYDTDVYLQQQTRFDDWFEQMKQYDMQEKILSENLERGDVVTTGEEEKYQCEEDSVFTFSISGKIGGK